MPHTMTVSDLTPADRKGNLTQNCAHQKSLQELLTVHSFVLLHSEGQSSLNSFYAGGREQPSGLAQSPAPEPGAWHSSGVGFCSKEPSHSLPMAPGTELPSDTASACLHRCSAGHTQQWEHQNPGTRAGEADAKVGQAHPAPMEQHPAETFLCSSPAPT